MQLISQLQQVKNTLSQYPLGPPSFSITLGITFLRCPIYFAHTSGVIVAQNCTIPDCSSSKFFGLQVFLKYCLSDPQTFSMGLRSGDSGGVGHQLTPFSSKNDSISALACLGSLSCCRRCLYGNVSLIKGSNPFSNTIERRSAFRIPVNMITFVAPLDDIPAQT